MLFVFAWLGAGAEESRLCLLATCADPARLHIDVLTCFTAPGVSQGAHVALERAGLAADRTPYDLSFDDTVTYLTERLPAYDLVVSCRNPPDVPAAVARLAVRPSVADNVDCVRALEAAAAHGRSARLAEAARAAAQTPFRSWIWGGFECSTHVRTDGQRVDVIDWTGHDAQAAADYRALAELGVRTVRDGARWHLIEPRPGRWEFDSLDEQVRAARRTGTQVVWDLLHFGWPAHVDLWGADFPRRFATYAAAVAERVAPAGAWFTPVNEVSFMAWAGGDVAYLNPFAHGRGTELKVQLVRAVLAAMTAIRAIVPHARFLQPEPLIHVAPPVSEATVGAADRYRHETGAAHRSGQAQYEAFDMLLGRRWPLLGGSAEFLDVVGVNYYPANQFELGGTALPADDPRRRPLGHLLAATYARYGRPLVVSETGTEGEDRAAWFAEVIREVQWARRRGVPVLGVCLYPVLGHPRWDDGRYCPNGLLEWVPPAGARSVHRPLADAVRGCITSVTAPPRIEPEHPGSSAAQVPDALSSMVREYRCGRR